MRNEELPTRLILVPEGMKECPECHVQLPEKEDVCDCGYEFWRNEFKNGSLDKDKGNC